MKVAIEARALSAAGGGVKTYAEQLIRHFLELEGGHTVTVIHDRTNKPEMFAGAREIGVDRYGDAGLGLWLGWQVPQRLRQLKPDVVHYTKAAVPRARWAPTVVTIYDIIPILFPESQKLSRRWYWPRTLRQAAGRSDAIITISEASKRDMVERLNIAPEKITVTPLAVDTGHFRPVKASVDTPYMLYVGTIEPRKNVPALVRAFAKIASDIPHELVIAGKQYKGMTDVQSATAKSAVEERIRVIDFVSYDELPALYAGADVFVWPSIYEGWGFPPQEAMACGTPVLVSDGGSLPEVVGEAGEIVPFSTDELSRRPGDTEFEERLAERMRALAQDATRKKRMRAAGLSHVQSFSWNQVATTTLGVYERTAR